MRVLRGIGVLVLLVGLFLVVAFVIGSQLPVAHTATATAVIDAPRAIVWRRIEDVTTQPGWRRGLRSVEIDASQNGLPCWTEVTSGMRMPLCETMSAAPATRIVHIVDPGLSFGGDWVYVLTTLDANATRITITENGTTRPALWRFAGHYIFHEDTMLKRYEQDLQKSFGR